MYLKSADAAQGAPPYAVPISKHPAADEARAPEARAPLSSRTGEDIVLDAAALDDSRVEPLPLAPGSPSLSATFEEAPTLKRSTSASISELPIDGLERPRVSRARAAVMKSIVGVALGACVVVLVIAGPRMLRRREDGGQTGEPHAVRAEPTALPPSIEVPVAVPQAPPASAPTSSSATSVASTTRTSSAPPVRHAPPKKIIRNQGSATRKAGRTVAR